MLGGSVAALLVAAGSSPLLQAGAIILATFILEDAATIFAAMAVADGRVLPATALAALYVGIVLGDLGLYGLGRLAAAVPPIARLIPPTRGEVVRAWLAGRVFRVVLVSRFLPGLRLPTYTTCGFLGADLRRFLLAAVVATSLWTTLLFVVSLHLGQVLIAHYGAWRWVGAAGLALGLILLGRLAGRMQGARP
ncbi:MAG: hypothetical protein BGP12_02055 [Rhodospirillales bacterium 70-18]|nr:VTT domain-containing protein [Rhodospirillales bacterium]OJY76358.1 MAG: hypothetical protein BGP12_02055 [Rhodospirillales bacterium 70-18]